MRRILLAFVLATSAAAWSCDGAGAGSDGDADADGDLDADTGGDGDADAPASACRFEPGTVEDYGPCGCDGDCMPGAICATEAEHGIPGGACLRPCDTEAPSCTGGTDCYAIEGTEGGCVHFCESAEDCGRPTGSCWGDLCQYFCQSDADCVSGHCDPYTTLCTDGTPSTGLGSFEPCLRNEDCRSGRCAANRMALCFSICRAESPGCPEGNTCIAAANPNEVDICFPHCETETDCPTPPAGYAFRCAYPTGGPFDHTLCILGEP